MKIHIETQAGYGTKQGIMPRFYLQMNELCSFIGVEPFVDSIPNKFLTKIIPELTNFYDVHNNLQSKIKEFIDGVEEGKFYKIDADRSTTFLRHNEFAISNLTKDFFIRGKILLVLFFKSDVIIDGNFKLSEYFFCDDKKFETKLLQYSSSSNAKYKPLLNVLRKARLSFLNDFSKTRGDIEHDSFELKRFKISRNEDKVYLNEPTFQNELLSKKIKFYYDSILELIEKLTAYFAGINCEEKNTFLKLYVTTKPDYTNLIYKYRYRIRELPFVNETVRCEYD